ncbi:hypothetical protein C0Q70_05766 [Pomacea canaliculata]|uniref:Cytochrome P450 n=1 Tax=Pomacea canaliculata TaxID=400727 RepID=A0A2T7PM40_POMCA|nr:hypothetical protein C0Q70_05766 [Pomacea canaliculata]
MRVQTYPDMLQLMLEAENEGDKETEVDPEIDHRKQLRTSAGWTRKGLTESEIEANSFIFLIAGYENTALMMAFLLFELAEHPECLQKVQEELDEKLGKKEVDYETVQELTYLEMCLNETMRLYPPGVAHTPEGRASRHPFSFLPFGYGPRNCIGMRLVLVEMKMAIAALLRQFSPVRSPKASIVNTNARLSTLKKTCRTLSEYTVYDETCFEFALGTGHNCNMKTAIAVLLCALVASAMGGILLGGGGLGGVKSVIALLLCALVASAMGGYLLGGGYGGYGAGLGGLSKTIMRDKTVIALLLCALVASAMGGNLLGGYGYGYGLGLGGLPTGIEAKVFKNSF